MRAKYYRCHAGFKPDTASLDARTTNSTSALYVPEKLKRRERQMPGSRRARFAAFSGWPAKNRFVAKANEAVFCCGATAAPRAPSAPRENECVNA
jgi:hypothetical protein